MRVHPDLPEVHLNYGTALASVGRMGEAIAQYSKALELRPELAEAHLDLAVALEQTGKPEEAMANISRRCQYRPAYAQAHYDLAPACRWPKWVGFRMRCRSFGRRYISIRSTPTLTAIWPSFCRPWAELMKRRPR